VHALGPANVLGVVNAEPYSSRGSIEDALALARIWYQVPPDADSRIPRRFQRTIRGSFCRPSEDTTEEKHAVAPAGMILMSLSNKLGHLLSHDRQQK